MFMYVLVDIHVTVGFLKVLLLYCTEMSQIISMNLVVVCILR